MTHFAAVPPALTPFDAILIALVFFVVPLLSLRTGRALAGAPRGDLMPRYRSTIAKALIGALLVFAAWHAAGRPFAALGLDWPIGLRGRLGFAVVAAIGGWYTYAMLVQHISPERAEIMRGRLEKLRVVPQTRGEFRLYPVMALIASSAEELLYRGYLIWLFTPFAGVWGAVVGSSVLFGLGHSYQGPIGVVRTGIIGAAFATGYVLTGSLWWLMAAHIMVNLFGGALAWRIQRLLPKAAT